MPNQTDELAKEIVAKRISGEIVLSNEPGQTIQKWRNIFKLPQRALAEQVKVMPSVISDYENSRRKSPGIKVIKKIVEGMIALDEKTGGKIVKEFSNFPARAGFKEAVIDMKEFKIPASVKDFCKSIGASLVARDDLGENKIYGYTVVDGLKAVVDLSTEELAKIYGFAKDRALIFAKSQRGKTTLVALKIGNVKPGLVVLFGSECADELAKRIATTEGIPLAINKDTNVDILVSGLKNEYKTK